MFTCVTDQIWVVRGSEQNMDQYGLVQQRLDFCAGHFICPPPTHFSQPSYSSSALSLSDRCLLQPEPEGRNHSARAEIKEQADARLARGATPNLLQARVDFLSSTILSSQHSQEINGCQKSRTLLWGP
ncbi:hypothetical protein CRENBAI_007887 [Crenichthys baileyi]|uniref:Uncharacterized protein n=1 Tax=Crenichthys baileyi TaxID=28760 RepID=A0AAV9RG48_9TELE